METQNKDEIRKKHEAALYANMSFIYNQLRNGVIDIFYALNDGNGNLILGLPGKLERILVPVETKTGFSIEERKRVQIGNSKKYDDCIVIAHPTKKIPYSLNEETAEKKAVYREEIRMDLDRLDRKRTKTNPVILNSMDLDIKEYQNKFYRKGEQ